jgi:hypothetical protein
MYLSIRCAASDLGIALHKITGATGKELLIVFMAHNRTFGSWSNYRRNDHGTNRKIGRCVRIGIMLADWRRKFYFTDARVGREIGRIGIPMSDNAAGN